MSKKISMLALIVVIFLLSGFIGYFFATGGRGLYNAMTNYIFANVPAKRYEWRDFVYRGVDDVVAGFYAGGGDGYISIWTLGGRRRFYDEPETSIFYFQDTCAIVEKQKDTGVKSQIVNPDTSFNMELWTQMMRVEYFVIVKPLEKREGKIFIDKTWGASGKYKTIGKVEEGVCD